MTNNIEEIKQRESEWLKVRSFFKKEFGKAPNMEGILFLIGLNVLGGNFKKVFNKEEKQDILHIATCHLLESYGYFKLDYIDTDGWPHYLTLKPLPIMDITIQEDLLKDAVIKKFISEGLI